LGASSIVATLEKGVVAAPKSATKKEVCGQSFIAFYQDLRPY
jgi:hypothetical protein